MNFLLVPSFNSEQCIPLSDFSWKMQISFCALFGLLLLITLFFGPNPKRTLSLLSLSTPAGEKRVASSLSLSAQELHPSAFLTSRTFIDGRPMRNSLFSMKVETWKPSEG